MAINDLFADNSSIQKLVFFNKKNKKILIIDGQINDDETQAIVSLKPHMRLYGVVKMVYTRNGDLVKEFRVIGMDKIQTHEIKNQLTNAYRVYLSRSNS